MRREPMLPYEASVERRLEIDGATAVADMFLPAMGGTAIMMPGARRRATPRSQLRIVRSLRRVRPL